jgi:hypothetical protein
MRTRIQKPRLQVFRALDASGTELFFINYNPSSAQVFNKSYASKAALVSDVATLNLVANTWSGVTGLITGAANIQATIKSEISFGVTENLGGGTIAGVVVVINRGTPPQDLLILPSSAAVAAFLTAFSF